MDMSPLAKREAEERRIVSRLLDHPRFADMVNGRGYLPWVTLRHSGHDAGVRVRLRIAREDGETFYAIYTDARDDADAHVATVVGTMTFLCSCGDRLSISQKDQVRAIASAILRDTREGKRFTASFR